MFNRGSWPHCPPWNRIVHHAPGRPGRSCCARPTDPLTAAAAESVSNIRRCDLLVSPWAELSDPLVKFLVKYHKDPYKPNLKKEFFRTWLVSSQGAPYIYIYIILSTVLGPMRQPSCITHGTHDPLTQKCPPPAGIGYLQPSSEPGCASWIVVKPVLKSMTYHSRLFKKTPRTTMVQLIPFILLGWNLPLWLFRCASQESYGLSSPNLNTKYVNLACRKCVFHSLWCLVPNQIKRVCDQFHRDRTKLIWFW